MQMNRSAAWRTSTGLLALATLSLAAAPTHGADKKDAAAAPAAAASAPIPAAEMHAAMRKLWEDHVVWTRNYIISAVANLEDTSKVAERLLKNQDDIGDAVKPFYGDDAGKKLSGLLREHILIAVDIVKAA